jgi:hypothetical protein
MHVTKNEMDEWFCFYCDETNTSNWKCPYHFQNSNRFVRDLQTKICILLCVNNQRLHDELMQDLLGMVILVKEVCDKYDNLTIVESEYKSYKDQKLGEYKVNMTQFRKLYVALRVQYKKQPSVEKSKIYLDALHSRIDKILDFY